MRRFVDLHTHSTASDGACEPDEVVRLAEARRLAAVALTDHDTLDGVARATEAAREFPRLRFITGIEVSARFTPGTLHILGLGIDPAAAALRGIIEQLLQARVERNPRIIAKLQALGMGIGMEDVQAAALAETHPNKRVFGRLHIALALARKGVVAGVREAFDRFLDKGRPAYVEKERLAPAEVIGAIRAAGGAVVLAHPVHLECANRSELERVVRSFMRSGLDAIEVYHSDHDDRQTRMYLDLARRLGLGITGGSDFHGANKPGARLGRPRVPLGVIAPCLWPLVRVCE
jgi:hypothetical protein